MGVLLPIAAAIGLVLFLKGKGSSSEVDTGIRQGIGGLSHVKGESGTEWDVQMTEAPTKPLAQGGSAVMQVILNDPKIPARRHKVIEYMQIGDKRPFNRTLVATGPSTAGLIQAAIRDFGVKGPAAEAALKRT